MFEHRPERVLIEKIRRRPPEIIERAQRMLGFAVGRSNMPMWKPCLEVLLEVIEHFEDKGSEKQWHEKESTKAERWFRGNEHR